MTDNLPSLVAENPHNLPVEEIRHDTDALLVKALNCKMMHSVFLTLADQWRKATTIDEVCKLSLVITKMMKDRMDFLELPYGHTNSTKKNEFIVYPPD